jgi:hypothetical protein
MTEEDEAFNDIERQAKQRKEAVKAAVHTLTEYQRGYETGFIDGMQKQMQSSVDKAVNRMAQTQEPKIGCVNHDCDKCKAQRTWVGLTDEDISEIVRGTHNTGSFVRAIEAKLKEKNNGV